MALLINSVLFLGVIGLTQYNFIMAGTIAPSESATRNLFSADLFPVIVDGKHSDNIVYSPASIHHGMTLAYLGADGKTADEMRNVLKLGNGDKTHIAEKHGLFWKNAFLKVNKRGDNAPELRMASRLYVNDQTKLSNKFNKIAKDNFGSVAESVDFRNSKVVAEHINSWMEQQTENKIKNLIQADSINADTSALLVNAMYFKGKWLHPFSETSTTRSAFHLNAKQEKQVETMYTNDLFGYGDFPELSATALELPYQDSDMSMLIILPNEVDGLRNLERKLNGVDFNDITSKMMVTNVDVFLPKFRIEGDLDLKEPFKKLGLTSMFSQSANFKDLFESSQPQRISDVKHKAFLDVNEAGSEAAAATYLKIVPMSLNLDQKLFRADHPFIFAIRDKTVVYVLGHVANP